MKKFIVAFGALSLAACASASKPGTMVAELTEATIIKDASKLRDSVAVGEVSGGHDTNPLWTSEVANADFAEALKQTFAAHAILAKDGGVYRLDAKLVKLKQPLAGFNMTVTSIVDYTLSDVKSGAVVMHETIENAYTAKAGDSLLGVKRLQLANEGSIKGNIAALIKRMIAVVDNGDPSPPASAANLADGPSS